MEPQKRHWSRRLALQALYQWQISGHDFEVLLAQYVEDDNWEKADKDYFIDLVSAVIKQNDLLNAAISPHLNLPTEQIDPIENAILLFATYELLQKSETPTNVILSEAVNLCKKFGSVEGYKFVNGVLDKVSQQRV